MPIGRRVTLALMLSLTISAASEAQDNGSGAPLLHGKLELSLAEAVRMGLENNLRVEIERYGPILANLDAEAAWGAYDPLLVGELGYEDAWSPSANLIEAGAGLRRVGTETVDGLGGIRGEVPMVGATYGLELSGSDVSSDAVFRTLDPQIDSTLSLNMRVPLLKDLLWNEPWTQVRVTGIQHMTARENFRLEVMNVVKDVEDAYWQLMADKSETRVARKSLETAQALLEQTETQFEVGVVSKVEVTEATAGVAEREFNLIRVENRYLNQQDEFIDLVLGPGLRPTSTLEVEPTDDAQALKPFEVNIDEAVQVAFAYRPELETARQAVERLEIQKGLAWNQRLPELDVEGRYDWRGLNGKERATGNDVNGRDYLQNFPDGNAWSVRGIFSIPIGNIEARKAYDKRTFELHRAETEVRRVEQEIILEVRSEARNLKASQEGIESAERAAEAAQEQLRAEKIRNEYGEATPFDVLQREEDLVDREVERIEAYRAFWSSAAALERAQGTILRNRNIKIDDVSTLR